MKIERIDSCPIAFANFKNKFNDAADVLEAAMQLTSNDGSLTITHSDNGTDFSVPSGGGGGGSGLPSGSTGDMLYHDGSDWVVLAAPTVSVADPVLRHNGTAPYWEEPESC